MESSNIAKWLVFVGLGIILVGGLFWLAGMFGFSLGKLPGDIHIKKEKGSVYFPIVTSIVLSIVLTLVLNFIFWIFRK